MADNTNEPRGFRPVGRVVIHKYVGGATIIYPGDMCAMNAGGKVTVAAAGGTQLVGVAASYKAAAGTEVFVYDDPDQVFLGQDDGSGTTAIATARIGLNTDIVATVGNATSMKSRHTVDRNPLGTATANLRILGISANQATGKYQEVAVVINEHFNKKATGVV